MLHMTRYLNTGGPVGTKAASRRTTTTRVRTASAAPAAVRPSQPLEKRTPGRARSDASRVAILGAALKLLETTPLQQISIESIAREAGVGKATIYRWWSSKAAVVIEAFVQYHVSHTAIPKGMGPREALARHMRLLVDEYGAVSGQIVAQILAEGQGDPSVLREFRERFWYGRRALVRELVEEARSKGEFRSDMETELQMDILYAPIYLRLIMRHMPLDRKFADAHVAAMMELLAPPAAEAAGKRRKLA